MSRERVGVAAVSIPDLRGDPPAATAPPVVAPRSALLGWKPWAVALVLVYVAITTLGWQRSMTWDEIWLLYYTGLPLEEQLAVIRNDAAHPPLIYLLMRGWVGLFGANEAGPKLLVAAISATSMVAFTYLAAGVTAHWRAATLLFSGIYWQVASVPNLVRAYGLVILMAVLSLILWQKWAETRRPRWLALWLVPMTVMIHLHYFGMLLLAAYVAVGIVQRLGARRVVLWSAVPALSIVPWLLYILPVIRSAPDSRPESLGWISAAGGPSDWVDLAYGFTTRIEPGALLFAPWMRLDDPTYTGPLEVAAVVFNLLVAAVLIAWAVRRRGVQHGRPQGRKIATLSMLVLLTVAQLIVVSHGVAPLFHPRFLVGLLPFYWLLVAAAADVSPRVGRTLLYLAVVWVAGTAAIATRAALGPWPVRAAVHDYAGAAGPGDLVLADDHIGDFVWWEAAWVRQRDDDIRVFRRTDDGSMVRREIAGNNIVPYIDLATVGLQGRERVWLLHANPTTETRAEEYLAANGFVRVQRPAPTQYGPFLFVRQVADGPATLEDAGPDRADAMRRAAND